MGSNIVYHYCSLDTFNLIISNKTLRVSDIRKSNDSEELKWISNGIIDSVIKYVLSNNTFCEKYHIDNNKISFIESQLQRAINAVFVNNSRTMISLVCCFSEVGDLLSQWRGYADDGNGISIGINKKILEQLNTYKFAYQFYKIEYSNQKQQQFLNKHISDIVTAYAQANSDEITDKTFSDFIMDLILRMSTLLNDAPAFKNKCFSEEKEWRICIKTFLYNIINGSNFMENTKDDIGYPEEDFNYSAQLSNGLIRYPISFSTRCNKLVPYVDLNFENIKNNFIKKIVIGPKCDVSVLDIQMLLASKGYDFDKIPIIHSSCTYR